MNFRFEEPALLFLLAPVAVAAAWSLLRDRRRPASGGAVVSSVAPARAIPTSWRVRLRFLPALARWLALALLVLAIARPQSGRADAVVGAEGIDVVLALDVSTSMGQAPFGRDETRLDVARRVVGDFIDSRENDRVGILLFRSQSLVLSPLTLDYDALTRLMESTDQAPIPDGTAIGLAVADSLNLLRESQARSRVVILLTDGENNRFEVEPLAAARIAEALNMRIYTIGIVPQLLPEEAALQTNVDEDALRTMAEITGGRYQRADTAEELESIYRDIGELEKSRVGGERFSAFDERAAYLLIAALALLALDIALAGLVFRRLG